MVIYIMIKIQFSWYSVRDKNMTLIWKDICEKNLNFRNIFVENLGFYVFLMVLISCDFRNFAGIKWMFDFHYFKICHIYLPITIET